MKKGITFVAIMMMVFAGRAMAQKSTRVVVRAAAKDAKFIGSSMGGAFITIKENKTGKVLAAGTTAGSTGNTDTLVREPHQRYTPLSTADAAKFDTTLELSEPTFVTISAVAPMAQKQSRVKSSTQLWLIPGKDIIGDGVVLEIPGFAIDILQPQVHEFRDKDAITITANAVMMCGCPTNPDGLWDSNEMEFTAVIKKGTTEIARKKMSFTGKSSTYQADFAPQEGGAYQIAVYGYDHRTGNTGLDRTTVVVQ